MVQLVVKNPSQVQIHPQAQQEELSLRVASAAPAVDDYNLLRNKPTIEGVELIGNRTFPDLHLAHLTNLEIEQLLGL